MDESKDKMFELLTEFHTAMLITRDASGMMRARPMAIACHEKNDELWFFTGLDTEKSDEIAADPRVSVCFQRDRSLYLSLWGSAVVLQDREKARSMWKEAFRVWFPEGPDDPELALIHFIPAGGEFWDSKGWKKARYAFQAARAYIVGKTPTVDEGEQHAEVQF